MLTINARKRKLVSIYILPNATPFNTSWWLASWHTVTKILIALAKAQHQINRMSSMVNSFLDISRLESGKMELNKSRIRLETLLKEVIDKYQYTQTTHKIFSVLDVHLKLTQIEIRLQR